MWKWNEIRMVPMLFKEREILFFFTFFWLVIVFVPIWLSAIPPSIKLYQPLRPRLLIFLSLSFFTIFISSTAPKSLKALWKGREIQPFYWSKISDYRKQLVAVCRKILQFLLFCLCFSSIFFYRVFKVLFNILVTVLVPI